MNEGAEEMRERNRGESDSLVRRTFQSFHLLIIHLTDRLKTRGTPR